MSLEQLEKIFNPKSIAVIGASSKKGSVGYDILNNLIDSKYSGKVFAVNNNRDVVQGKKAYNSIEEIKGNIDLAIIAIPANTVLNIIQECGRKGIKGVVIISSGFLETGVKGEKLCKEIVDLARTYRIRIIGPNCLGFMRPKTSLNASFAPNIPKHGNIAFISQSGALGTGIIDWAIQHNLGFSFFASIGSMIDIGFHDIIDYLSNDKDTKSIVIYMESLKDARKFMSAARAFSRQKPLIVLKAGKSKKGAAAAMSHTGSLAGDDSVFDAAFKRAGIVRVDEIEDLFDCARALSKQKRPRGNKLAIVTNAGGPGVIAIDKLEELGGIAAKLDKKTIAKLDKVLPKNWSKQNPVDVLGDAGARRYKESMKELINDENVDSLLVILTPQSMTETDKIAKEIVKIKNMTNKPIIASFMGGDLIEKGRRILEKGNIPVFRTPERAVKSFMYLYNYKKNLDDLYQTPGSIPHAFKPNTKDNKKIISSIMKQKRFVLTENESKQILKNYQIPVTNSIIAKSLDDAIKIAEKIGYPVVLKIASPDIIHKTEYGLVKINVVKESIKEAYAEILKNMRKYNPDANIHGVIVEEMAGKKYELLIGSKKDNIFGPVIVFGMGGVAVNLFEDVNVGLPPLNMALSKRLIEDTKVYELLKGYRNMKGVDIKSIQFLLYKFAYLIADFPEIKEIDINPFSVDENSGVVLDAKIILDNNYKEENVENYSHLVISPYPKEYVKEVKLKNGNKALFRPIKPEDEPMEAEMFKKMSKQTQRFRFFKQISDITHELLIRYTQIDYDREIAIIAEIESKEKKGEKEMAGVVRLITDPYDKNSEFAIVVADPFQRQGLGNELTDYMIEIAKLKGIKKIFAKFLFDNDVVQHIFEKKGFKIIKDKNKNIFRAELELV